MVQGIFDEEEKKPEESVSGIFGDSLWDDVKKPDEPPVVMSDYMPESTDETIRQSGLAWSAGIVFFGSVAFMLFLGWLADILLGSSPWGIVGGIVLGSIIGFIQFFRISSQIFSSKKPHKDIHTLMSRGDKDGDDEE